VQSYPAIKKLPADSPEAGHYGLDITRGKYVWAAYDGTRLVAIAATVGEAKRLYRQAYRRHYEALKLVGRGGSIVEH